MSAESSGSSGSSGLARFVDAQDAGGTYDAALRELRAGRKRTHWMWFVFPQVEDRPRPSTAQHFGVRGLTEARAYVAHPVLGPRLVQAARALVEQPSDDPVEVLGTTDAMKLRSSMTLFAAADPDQPVYGEVLERFFDGEADEATLARI